MSLYNMTCGNSAVAPFLLAIIDAVHPAGFERLRDAYPVVSGEEITLAVYTRTGGGNREDYADSWRDVRAHPLFMYDEDDDFDNTYATAYFRCPDEIVGPLLDLVHVAPHIARTAAEKFETVISSIKGEAVPAPAAIDEAAVNAAGEALVAAVRAFVAGHKPTDQSEPAKAEGGGGRAILSGSQSSASARMPVA